ncbi:MAG: UDP-glucose 4-epimerase GalE [Bacteroidetes bacterium]|nr:UDP-glucose 4-epimerase GalE [Bacteroidota bacterium]
MSEILVTGGLGYIGSHTVTCLSEAGYDVVIIDNLSNSTLDTLDTLRELCSGHITFCEVEMCRQEELNAVFEKHPNLAGVIHFAALLQVNESVQQPVRYYRNNLDSTLNLIDACAQFKVPSVVFSSSCTVYGQPEMIPVDESAPIAEAESPYGSTKIMCERIFRDACEVLNLNVLSLRYFNPIGAHPSAKIGEVQHGEPHHLVPYITETAIGKREVLKVFGSDYDTRDGSCIRDYIHVMDIAEAHVAAIGNLIDGKTTGFDPINLGSGTGQTVVEMIKAFEAATGLSVPYVLADRRPGDVEKVYANIGKATSVLGWRPTRGLEETLKSAWVWEQSQRVN